MHKSDCLSPLHKRFLFRIFKFALCTLFLCSPGAVTGKVLDWMSACSSKNSSCCSAWRDSVIKAELRNEKMLEMISKALDKRVSDKANPAQAICPGGPNCPRKCKTKQLGLPVHEIVKLDPLEPTYSCSTLERLPFSDGDGPKFICGVQAIGKRGNCLVFSLGSDGNVQFERAIHESRPDCKVHTFDPTLSPRKKNFMKNEERKGILEFHDVGASAVAQNIVLNGQQVSLQPIDSLISLVADSDNHPTIHLLKVDIEGYEYEILTSALRECQQRARPLFDQLAIELHSLCVEARIIYNMVKSLSRCGYRLVSKERNHWGCRGAHCAEFTFVNADHAWKEFQSTRPSCK